jgi:hypothetical protein
MRAHQVQVDNEVFEFVKSNAEPLVDDFNSALRRLLSLNGAQPKTRPRGPAVRETNQARVLPTLPPGTPVALRHILEVAHLVRGGAYTRTAATQFVAKQDNVFPQTVIDKYCRQLGLTASQFDRMLEEENLSGLRKLLKAKFNEHSDVIDQFTK